MICSSLRSFVGDNNNPLSSLFASSVLLKHVINRKQTKVYFSLKIITFKSVTDYESVFILLDVYYEFLRSC